MEVVLGVAVVLIVTLTALLVAFARDRHQLLDHLDAAQARVAELEADLDAALRPLPPTSPAERAVRGLLRRAVKVRSHGISGLIASTVEDLQAWVGEDARADILNMASPDGTVTLFFSDIEDSTRLNDRLGDRAWVKVLAAHDRVLRARIERNRGQVVKTAGDGFMVAFRDTEAACRAALEIQRDLGRDTTLRRLGPIRVRIGIHTGQVVARDGDYFGRNVAMAARVADLADGGEVLVSTAVVDAVPTTSGLTFDDVATVELKGLSGEHALHRLLRT